MPQIGEIRKGREISKWDRSRQFIWVQCLDCKTEEWVTYHSERPPRKRCRSCSMKLGCWGKQNGSWKGGICTNMRKWWRDYAHSHREAFNLRSARWRARKLNTVGSFTVDEWEQCKEKYKYCCACCRRGEPQIKLCKDHIVPLSLGGNDFIENIQPLCLECNQRKSNKPMKFDQYKNRQLVMMG